MNGPAGADTAISSPAGPKQPVPPTGPTLTVRIGPFTTGRGEPALATALPDLLADRLARWPGVRVVNERPAARSVPDGPPPASPGRAFGLTGSYAADWQSLDLTIEVTPDG
ncbi:MAG: hypothetical protein JWO38_1858 [Gemmataceae bacterium]|nr:hypothetical protein [Gemmataceae bacterium]